MWLCLQLNYETFFFYIQHGELFLHAKEHWTINLYNSTTELWNCYCSKFTTHAFGPNKKENFSIGRFCSYPWLLYILSMHKSWLWLLNTFRFGPVNLRGKLIFACAWQRWLLRIPVSAYVSCHGFFPLCQFPFDQCWQGGNWQSGNGQRWNWRSGKLTKWEGLPFYNL